jgi:DNA helicase-2/ATP-dependent DNA helicase PcrA
MSTVIQQLAAAKRAFLVAAAGCGKTQAIACAVAESVGERQLILTHTHAGVHSLRKRLQSLGVPRKQYEVETIAGWSLRLALAYPVRSGFGNPKPQTSTEWTQLYVGATQLLSLPFMQDVIQATYAGVYVDEYQDCTQTQHRLILALAQLLPCRVLGDPLQGIFGFGNDTIIDWDADVRSEFDALPSTLDTPWRWQAHNQRLGEWLSEVRTLIEAGQPIDLDQAPICWLRSTENNQRRICFDKIRAAGTVIAIHPENHHAHGCHKLASQLRGNYHSIEEMEAKALMKWARQIELAHTNERAVATIDFASECMTQVSTQLRGIKDKFSASGTSTPDFSRIRKHEAIAAALVSASHSDDLADVVNALRLIREIGDAYLYRADLWYEMLRSIKAYLAGGFSSLPDAAWHVRTQARFSGRRDFQRIVSRTLLVKGLEFDHAIVLDADNMDTKNLYVALTRGSKSLTVLSQEPVLNPWREE